MLQHKQKYTRLQTPMHKHSTVCLKLSAYLSIQHQLGVAAGKWIRYWKEDSIHQCMCTHNTWLPLITCTAHAVELLASICSWLDFNGKCFIIKMWRQNVKAEREDLCTQSTSIWLLDWFSFSGKNPLKKHLTFCSFSGTLSAGDCCLSYPSPTLWIALHFKKHVRVIGTWMQHLLWYFLYVFHFWLSFFLCHFFYYHNSFHQFFLSCLV